jgi:hypothetical protein
MLLELSTAMYWGDSSPPPVNPDVGDKAAPVDENSLNELFPSFVTHALPLVSIANANGIFRPPPEKPGKPPPERGLPAGLNLVRVLTREFGTQMSPDASIAS